MAKWHVYFDENPERMETVEASFCGFHEGAIAFYDLVEVDESVPVFLQENMIDNRKPILLVAFSDWAEIRRVVE